MKKLLIASAIAAAATGAQAASYDVSSNVTDIQLWNGFANFNAAVLDPIVIGGTAEDADDDGNIDATDLTFGGSVLFDAAGVDVRVVFDMTGGAFSANGTTFTSGNIFVYTDPNDGTGEILFDTVDVSANNIPMLAVVGGGHAVPGAQSTAGLNVDVAGVNALPGLWDGAFNGAGFNSGVSSVTLLGNTAGLFLDGDVTLSPSEVPVPAAAWLFGSALLGLAGVGRKRKMA